MEDKMFELMMLEDIFNGSKYSFLDRKISMGKIEKKAQAVLDTTCAFCLGLRYYQKPYEYNNPIRYKFQ